MTKRRRSYRKLIRWSILALLLAITAVSGLLANPPAPSAAVNENADTVTRYYTMIGRVRPFMFWMSKADIGGARISWTRSEGPDKWFELLIGSDPERAPMSLNRWGFVTEETIGNTTKLIGLMTETDDKSIDAAKANSKAVSGNSHVFSTISATVRDNEATSSLGHLSVDEDYSYRHYRALLDRLSETSATVQRLRVGADIEPGFLTAMKSLVHASVERSQRNPKASGTIKRDFVYNGKIYQITLTGANLLANAIISDTSYGPAIEGDFEIRNTVTGYVTPFHMTYGAAGGEAECPLRIVYRPRWWMEFELALARPEASRAVAMLANLPTSRIR